jgi:hypothetical protein
MRIWGELCCPGVDCPGKGEAATVEQLSLFDPYQAPARDDRPRRQLGPDEGVRRLMRRLVRDGLDERDLLPAAALVIEMDRQAAER